MNESYVDLGTPAVPARKSVIIVGAGLVGCLMSVFLAKRGWNVKVYEFRGDYRANKTRAMNASETHGQLTDATKRSINLALSYRGICALKAVGLMSEIESLCIPMKGRLMHDKRGDLSFLPYGVGDQAILSVSRSELNYRLMDAAEGLGVTFVFNYKCRNILKNGDIEFEIINEASNRRADNLVTFSADLIVGADGAFSSVRSCMSKLGRHNENRQFISHGYKEIHIGANENGTAKLETLNALHIWPRSEFMMIALPNQDKTFTCTVFAPWTDFDNITTESEIKEHWEENYKDLIPLVPDYVQQWQQNPRSSLLTLSYKPWNFGAKVILVGDAAHAIVPFFGQGMNCGFEDCLMFNEILNEFNDDLTKTLPAFSDCRQPACDALAKLSLDNYVEMRHHSAKLSFILQKKLEKILHYFLGSAWIPQYTMVAFTRIPYDEALEKGQQHDKIIKYATWASMAAVVGVVIAKCFLGSSTNDSRGGGFRGRWI